MWESCPGPTTTPSSILTVHTESYTPSGLPGADMEGRGNAQEILCPSVLAIQGAAFRKEPLDRWNQGQGEQQMLSARTGEGSLAVF